jgi:hypothetical protein
MPSRWKYAAAAAGGLALGLAVWWFFPRGARPEAGATEAPPTPRAPLNRNAPPPAPDQLPPPPGVVPPPPALPLLGPVPAPSGDLPPLPKDGFVPPPPPRPKPAGPHGQS